MSNVNIPGGEITRPYLTPLMTFLLVGGLALSFSLSEQAKWEGEHYIHVEIAGEVHRIHRSDVDDLQGASDRSLNYQTEKAVDAVNEEIDSQIQRIQEKAARQIDDYVDFHFSPMADIVRQGLEYDVTEGLADRVAPEAADVSSLFEETENSLEQLNHSLHNKLTGETSQVMKGWMDTLRERLGDTSHRERFIDLQAAPATELDLNDITNDVLNQRIGALEDRWQSSFSSAVRPGTVIAATRFIPTSFLDHLSNATKNRNPVVRRLVKSARVLRTSPYTIAVGAVIDGGIIVYDSVGYVDRLEAEKAENAEDLRADLNRHIEDMVDRYRSHARDETMLHFKKMQSSTKEEISKSFRPLTIH